MTALIGEHAGAVVFFAILLLFERLRRTPALALVRHPMFAYLVRGALVAGYFALSGVDPIAWFQPSDSRWIALGVIVAAVLAVARRVDVASLARGDPTMVLQATYLAIVVAVVEELIFRGAFVLVAATAPMTALLASLGSSVAYVVWRAVAYRERDSRGVALVFAVALAAGAVTAIARSLWPAVLAHSAYALVAGPPRASRHAPQLHPESG